MINHIKYLSFTGLSVRAGLSHQKSNLIAMAKEAHLCGRVLCVPVFHLCANHNFGRPVASNLQEYYAMETLAVEGVTVRWTVEAPPELAAVPAMRWDAPICSDDPRPLVVKDASSMRLLRPTYERIYPGLAALDVRLEIHADIRVLAEEVARGLPEASAWVHVRRGDLLHVTRDHTTPAHIAATLRRFCPGVRTVYLATNEPDLKFFAPLAEEYDVICVEDIGVFRDFATRDNYRLFLAEQALADHFAYRISTFRTPGNHFHGWLCDREGWQ